MTTYARCLLHGVYPAAGSMAPCPKCERAVDREQNDRELEEVHGVISMVTEALVRSAVDARRVHSCPHCICVAPMSAAEKQKAYRERRRGN